jgi:hypothetical protein
MDQTNIENQEPEPKPEELRHWCETTGAWSVGVGYAEAEKRINGWPGHLVAYLPQHRILLDASVDQANRPVRGIILPPVLTVPNIPSRFLNGDTRLVGSFNGMFLEYRHVPNETFRTTKDWTEYWRIKDAVKRILKRMKDS